MTEDLRYLKTYKDGRVLAINVWQTGAQELVYDNKVAFERAREAVTQRGEVPVVGSYTAVA